MQKQSNDSPEKQPPKPPRLPRAFRLTAVQRLGLPFLFAIPILALLGVFGETYRDAGVEGAGLSACIHYPSRIHYRQPLAFRLIVANTDNMPADSMIVSLDPNFMRAFTAVTLSTPLHGPYTIKLGKMGAGERRIVTGEVSGDRYGSSAGRISIRGPRGEIGIPVSTFVFP